MGSIMIEIKNLSKRFDTASGTVEALKNVSISIPDGDIFGIIGMFVGVPAFAVIYKFTKEYLENKLNEKNLPEKTESYKVIRGSKNLDDIEKRGI